MNTLDSQLHLQGVQVVWGQKRERKCAGFFRGFFELECDGEVCPLVCTREDSKSH